jgi:glycosyltransferase involved in cell wall biosynthesis
MTSGIPRLTGSQARDGTVLIVVPTLGARPELLRASLNSVVSQVSVPLTAVVVAPSTATSVAALCEELGVRFVAQASRGIGAAINYGWQLCGDVADYWGWLGDDDLLAEGGVAWSVRVLDRMPAAAMVYGDCEYIDAAGRRLFVARPTRWAASLLRWGPNLVPQPGSLARAAAVASAKRLDESLRYAMDLDLFLRLQRVGPIVYTPRTLAAFRWHEGSTTVSATANSEQEARYVRRRSWRGWERIAGRLLEVPAGLAGQVLYRVQRRSA